MRHTGFILQIEKCYSIYIEYRFQFNNAAARIRAPRELILKRLKIISKLINPPVKKKKYIRVPPREKRLMASALINN